MKNLFKILVALMLVIGSVKAETILSTFNDGATNQAVATDVFIPPGDGCAVVTDLAVASDITGSRLFVFQGKKRLTATVVGATTNLYFSSAEAGSIVTNEFLVIPKGTNYQLVQATSINSSTNVGISISQVTAVPVGAAVYNVGVGVERWYYHNTATAGTLTNSLVQTPVQIWFPDDHASAIRVTNGTTAGTKLFISGSRQR